MTDFTLSPAYTETFEDLSWDLTSASGAGHPGGRWVQNGTLDISLFSSAQHYPNGYLKSGLVLGKVTSGGLLGPYIDTQTDGRQTAVGLLVASVPVTRLVGGSNRTKIGVAFMIHGVVSVGRLPYTSGNAALGGFIDANGQTDLKLIYFAA